MSLPLSSLSFLILTVTRSSSESRIRSSGSSTDEEDTPAAPEEVYR